MSKAEKLVEVPSYIDGEKFVFNVPADIATLDCKISSKYHWNELPWSPWPTKKGIVRRMGSFFLKLHETVTKETGSYAKPKVEPVKVVREVSGNPDVWYLFDPHNWDNKDKTGTLPTFNGRHILTMMEQDFPDLKDPGHGVSHEQRMKMPYMLKINELRTPAPIAKEILDKVYGRSHPRVEVGYTNYENANRNNKFQLELEWYRKELLKIQRKLANEAKKEQAQEQGITVADINEQKRKEAEIARAALLTKEWVDISKEVFKTIDFLNDVVRQMGQRQELDREWFDKGRRDMRELSNTMRPLNKHFGKDAD